MIRHLLWFLDLDDIGFIEFCCATGDYVRAFGAPRQPELVLLTRAVIARFGPADADRFGRTVDDYLRRQSAMRSRRRTPTTETSPDADA